MKSKFYFALGIVLIMCSCLLSQRSFAQVTWTESFENTIFPPPSGWSVSTGNVWTRVTNGFAPTCTPHTGSGMTRFGSFNATDGTKQSLISPVIDYSQRSGGAAIVSLWIYRDSNYVGDPDSLTIFMNTTPDTLGATRLGGIARPARFNLPDTVVGHAWYQYSFPVPAFFTGSTNYLILRGTSSFGLNIFVDDIQWDSYPAMCTGQPVAGTIAAGNTFFCDSMGITTLSIAPQTVNYGITYQWQYDSSGTWINFGTNNLAVSTDTIIDTTTYRVIIGCTFSSMSDTSSAIAINVNNNPYPTITVSPPNAGVCANTTTPVLLIASGAVNYTWAPAAGLDTTAGDSVYSYPSSSTFYTVTGTDSIGCSGRTFKSVQYNQPPTVNMIAQSNPMCLGDSALLIAGTFSFSRTYLWSPGGQTNDSIYVSPTDTTTYIATVTSTFSGCITIDTIVLDVIPAVTASFTSSGVAGYTVSFTDNSTNATSWFWNFGDGDTSTSQSPVHTFANDSSYDVTLYASNAGCTDSMTVTIVVVGVGTHNITAGKHFQLSPNPAGEQITLEFNAPVQEANYTISNYLGQIISKKEITAAGNHFRETIPLEKLSPGIYFITVQSGADSSVQKFEKR